MMLLVLLLSVLSSYFCALSVWKISVPPRTMIFSVADLAILGARGEHRHGGLRICCSPPSFNPYLSKKVLLVTSTLHWSSPAMKSRCVKLPLLKKQQQQQQFKKCTYYKIFDEECTLLSVYMENLSLVPHQFSSVFQQDL